MSIEYQPHPEEFRGAGTVFIAWQPADETYEGYWDSSPDGSPGIPIEPMPSLRSLGEAVGWGRQRTPRVLIRPQTDSGEYYWAGVGEPLGTDAKLKPLSL